MQKIKHKSQTADKWKECKDELPRYKYDLTCKPFIMQALYEFV